MVMARRCGERRAAVSLEEAEHLQYDYDDDDNSDDIKHVSAHSCGAYQPDSFMARSFDTNSAAAFIRVR